MRLSLLVCPKPSARQSPGLFFDREIAVMIPKVRVQKIDSDPFACVQGSGLRRVYFGDGVQPGHVGAGDPVRIPLLAFLLGGLVSRVPKG